MSNILDFFKDSIKSIEEQSNNLIKKNQTISLALKSDTNMGAKRITILY